MYLLRSCGIHHEVKPASHSQGTNEETIAINKLKNVYVASNPDYYRIGDDYIQDGVFDVYDEILPHLDGKYRVTYRNALNGLILYRFDINEEEKEEEKVPNPDTPLIIPKDDEDDKDDENKISDEITYYIGWRFPHLVSKEYRESSPFGSLYHTNSDYELANLLADFIMASVASSVIFTFDRYSSVQPTRFASMFMAGLLSPRDYLAIMEVGLGINKSHIPEIVNGATGNIVADTENVLDLASRQRQSDPLAINIDGTGIETLPLKSGVYFDHIGNGFKIRTGWTAPNTGLLVRDLNGNGRIDSGRELFGDNTVLKSGAVAANGFEALKDLCESDDGIFDERSAAFHELYLWFDLNSNGMTEPGELIPLSETGIASIDLNYQDSDYVDQNGNAFMQISTAELEDGTVVDAIDVWFARDVQDSQAADQGAVSSEIDALPQIRGFGTTHSLHQAMELDGSGQLKALVEQFIEDQEPGGMLHVGFIANMHAMLMPGSVDIELF